jgi:hypothetical protein
MKLQDWADQYKILEINARMPPESAWPKLDELFTALETFPRISTSLAGYGIFIGWRTDSRMWAYHHSVCIPASQCNGYGDKYGFNNMHDENNISSRRVVPTLNAGDLPESQHFVRLLHRIGLMPVEVGEVMVTPRLALPKENTYEARTNNFNKRVSR